MNAPGLSQAILASDATGAPSGAPASAGTPGTSQEPTDITRHPRYRQKRLLVVDDDDVDRERIGRYIKKFRLPVVVLDAGSGSDAMKELTRGEVDLILLDYQLGDMTGTELLARIQEEHSSTIPTIMVTGMGDEKTAVEALRLGVLDYLPKNTLTAESLLAVLESALKNADLEKKLNEAQERLKQLSLYDELTGLPNRNLFFDRLNQAVALDERSGGHFSLLMIDLNLFKEVNDSLGHAAGDQVLATVGQRLRNSARKSDTLARLGGDEFACILHDVHNVSDAIACADKIISNISQPIVIGERVVQIGAAIGIARYPEHGIDANTILSNADSAMYTAKRSHRKYVCFNEEQTAGGTGNRVASSQYLYQAIRDHELFLEYQPKIDIQSRQIIGVEALVRWHSPKFGLVMPDDFIPAAERSSLIEDLTFSVMDMAFAQMKVWHEAGKDIEVAINLSARMLDDQELPEKLLRRLAEQAISPHSILLEITETTLASSSAIAHLILAELLAAGIRVSIDDFGSGFTSFRHIYDHEFSELKIDRMFIENIRPEGRGASIIRSFVLLAESLGMKVVAEGVETRMQLETLNKLGCHHAQGYGIARPMNAQALTTWMEAFQSGRTA